MRDARNATYGTKHERCEINGSAPANTFLGTETFLFSGSAAVAAGQSVRRPREGSGVGGTVRRTIVERVLWSI